MKSRISKSVYGVTLAFVLALAGAAFLTPARDVGASTTQGPESEARKLEGTWRVEVTPRNCQTGAPLGSSFTSLLSFARGGVLIETTSRFSPAMRGPAHGVWQHTGGHTFSATAYAFLYNSSGAWTGTQKITQTIEIGGDPDEFNANATSEIFDTNGNLIQSGCSTAVGHRLE
jgi:hypothetical protein